MIAQDMHSYNTVGTMYYYGLGVTQNLKRAFEIFSECSNMQSAPCYNSLGLMYQRGDYVKQDILKAYILFRKSAKLGNSYG
jgi:TPR repeat protein